MFVELALDLLPRISRISAMNLHQATFVSYLSVLNNSYLLNSL